MAVATPAMLPVPIVPAKAVDTAWKGLIPPLLSRWAGEEAAQGAAKNLPHAAQLEKPLPIR